MACCLMATSHYLNQCWPNSVTTCGMTRGQCVNSLMPSVGELQLRKIGLNSLNPGDAPWQWRDTGQHSAPFIFSGRLWDCCPLVQTCHGDQGEWSGLWCKGHCITEKFHRRFCVCEINYERRSHEIDGLVQEKYNSIALAMELHLSCTNPSKYCLKPCEHGLSQWEKMLHV